jgi:hypothetical protein
MTDYPGLEGLGDAFGEIFSKCRGLGMPLPYLVALVGINGSSTVYRMTAGKDHDGLDAEALVSHEVGGGFAIPINIMIVDASGDAVRVTMGHDRTFTIH